MTPARLPFALLVGVVTAAATAFGGALALRVRAHRGLLFEFSSGAMIGVARLDLLPEALDLPGPDSSALATTTMTADTEPAHLNATSEENAT